VVADVITGNITANSRTAANGSAKRVAQSEPRVSVVMFFSERMKGFVLANYQPSASCALK
jgi:hypothetical protein